MKEIPSLILINGFHEKYAINSFNKDTSFNYLTARLHCFNSKTLIIGIDCIFFPELRHNDLARFTTDSPNLLLTQPIKIVPSKMSQPALYTLFTIRQSGRTVIVVGLSN
ncbi:hypothetical protein SAMN05518856_12852 [Paenibacillus sp. OK003]|nr:hypothetical protein SAMN05518856_12852 [Paenibacillus sp. OK003]